jgi:hypothetical protein
MSDIDRTQRHVRAGAARSEREIVMYVGAVAPCPACGHQGLTLHDVRPADGNDAAVAAAQCPICYTPVAITFARGPGWDRQPPDDDPRLALVDEPSTLIPEALFLANVADDILRIDGVTKRAVLHAVSSRAISDLVELAKFRALSGDERAALQRFADAYAGSGGTIDAELAANLAKVR